MLLRMLALAVLALAVAAAAQQLPASTFNPAPLPDYAFAANQQLSKVCLPANSLGLSGERPVVSGFWWNGTSWMSVPVFVDAYVVDAVYIWDLNKTNPPIYRVKLLPPILGNNTKICMYLPRGRAHQRPQPPGHPGVLAKIATDAGDVHYVFIATDIPGAVPANLTAAGINARALEVARIGGGRPPAIGAVADTAQPSASAISTQYSSTRDWSLSWQGTIGGAFKLKGTEMALLNSTRWCGGGYFEVPPGVPRIDVVITAASTKTTWYVYVTAEGGTYQYVAYLPDSAPYVVVSHYFRSSSTAKGVSVSICPADISLKTATLDAFIYVEGAVYRYPTLWHNVISGGVGGEVYKNGLYVIVPGVHVPPGSVVNPLLRADIVVYYSGLKYPNPINIYLGSTPIATAYGRDLGNSVVEYYVATTFDAREHLRTGGATDSLIIGPVDGYYLFLGYVGIEGVARPEINRPESRIFRDAATPWLQATYTYLQDYSVNLYMYRADIRIIDRAGSIQLDGMRLAGVLSPRTNYEICDSSSGQPALRLYLDLYRGSDGALIRDWGVGLASIQTQGSSEPQLAFLKLIVEVLVRLFEAAGWIAKALGESFGWIMFAADLYSAASGPSSVSWYTTSAGDLVVQVNVNYQDARRPVAFGVVFNSPYSSLGDYDDYVVSVKKVEMCGKVIYDAGTAQVGGAEYYMPKSYIYYNAVYNYDQYRTFTCGAQEDLSSGGNAYSCNIDKYR
ncbi:MAG: hypothetical protein ACP5I3_07045 [Thermoproteus sp.]